MASTTIATDVKLAVIRRGARNPELSSQFYGWLLGLVPEPTNEGFRLACANGELVIHSDLATPIGFKLDADNSEFDGHDPDGIPVAVSHQNIAMDGVVSLDHISMNCANLAESIDFYRKLGFVLTWSGTPPDYEDPVRGFHDELPPGADWVHLSGADGYLALSQADWKDYGTHTADSGPPRFVHVGFAVPDLAGIATLLDTNGIPYKRASHDQIGARLYLNDPDGDPRLGTNIELIQYEPDVPRSGQPPYSGASQPATASNGVAIETTVRVRVCTLQELERDRFRVISAERRTILVLLEQGQVFALDNRCPHMGFPLHRGTVSDGILTCHWHHAKFDLAGGCTLDPFADDVPAFATEVRDGVVYVDPKPIAQDKRRHRTQKLTEGLEQNIRLVLAKSVIGLDELEATNDILLAAALFGVKNRASGWSAGLSILTAMANILPSLAPEDRRVALYQGLAHVAQSTVNQPPNFDLEPLETGERRPERYIDWFRRFIDSRSAEAAERTLRTAIRIGLSQADVATMVFAACTDHLYLDEGHALDFANKAFELLDHIGWEQAEAVLPSLVPSLVTATRMEETSSWRHPVDLPGLLSEVYGELDDLIEAGKGDIGGWDGHQALAETILDGEPAEIIAVLRERVHEGVPLIELSAAVAYTAARRPVHFHVSNEFGDWDTVHHTLTYTNAVDQALRRSPSNLLARGIFDGAMSVYLERFLNVPKQPIPAPSGMSRGAAELLAAFDVQGQVDETAQVVADLLAEGRREEVVRMLGHALLREDAGFHMFQIYEACLRQYRRFAGTPAGDHVLLGASRFLTAHSPTVRATGQTFDIAARLHRGESLHGDA